MITAQRVREHNYLFGGNREAVIQRDGEKCVNCGMSRAEHYEKFGKDLTVDHIDRNGINVLASKKNNALDNLQTLCFPCHGAKSFADTGQRRSEHGDLSMYTNHKCRCEVCQNTHSSYMKLYKKSKKAVKRG